MESEHTALSAVVAKQASELAAAENALADMAAQQATKISGFSSRVSELESRLQKVGEEVSMHKRKAFALQKECNAAKSNAEEQAKAFKELKKEKMLRARRKVASFSPNLRQQKQS